MRKNRVVEQNRCYHLVSRLAHWAFFLDPQGGAPSRCATYERRSRMLHLLGKVVKRKEVRIPQPKAVRLRGPLAGLSTLPVRSPCGYSTKLPNAIVGNFAAVNEVANVSWAAFRSGSEIWYNTNLCKTSLFSRV